MTTKNKVLSALMGILLGIGMGIVMLWSCRQNGFVYDHISFAFLIIIACALPECTERLEKRGFLPKYVRPIMIIVSYFICILYCLVVTKDVAYVNSACKTMCISVSILHVVSLIFCLIRLRRI